MSRASFSGSATLNLLGSFVLSTCMKLLLPLIGMFSSFVSFSAFRQYKLPMGNIIAFPKSNDPSSAPDFPPGKHVLAVYPGTTALYKATVVQGPRRVIILSFSSV